MSASGNLVVQRAVLARVALREVSGWSPGEQVNDSVRNQQALREAVPSGSSAFF